MSSLKVNSIAKPMSTEATTNGNSLGTSSDIRRSSIRIHVRNAGTAEAEKDTSTAIAAPLTPNLGTSTRRVIGKSTDWGRAHRGTRCGFPAAWNTAPVGDTKLRTMV